MQSITFLASNNVKINGLRSINSQVIHVAIAQCDNVNIQNLNVRASTSSLNTDGIHVESSTGVTITRSVFRTGDDCISIGPATTNVWIQRIACGPGHGISIGSLGNGLIEGGVQNVTVTGVVFTGTQNGVRIKTWARPSNGFARNIEFRYVIMRNVGNPIIIDQEYCPNNQCPTMTVVKANRNQCRDSFMGSCRTVGKANRNQCRDSLWDHVGPLEKLTGIKCRDSLWVMSDRCKSRTLKRCAQSVKRRAQSIKRCAGHDGEARDYLGVRARFVVWRQVARDARVCLGYLTKTDAEAKAEAKKTG
ncbi:hypothetical protein TEA_029523 [Camellia sinensis var. sinensis]|uniref:Polygalacturonase n=1 Tax=Camellia sinensis var. sinensis TaxID=542762 RepID=A0A4S4D7M2_CAMSN|nr:hypothetical protein TEA_029523 [Camellia sinensis var. sinensis]